MTSQWPGDQHAEMQNAGAEHADERGWRHREEVAQELPADQEARAQRPRAPGHGQGRQRYPGHGP